MILAILLVFGVLAVSMTYLSKSKINPVEELQMIKISQDIMAILEYDETLDTLDEGQINQSLSELLPKRYGMRIIRKTP